MQARYKASFSTDLAHYLEQREFYAVPEYHTCTGQSPKFSINFGKFQYCLKNRRLGHSKVFPTHCTGGDKILEYPV